MPCSAQNGAPVPPPVALPPPVRPPPPPAPPPLTNNAQVPVEGWQNWPPQSVHSAPLMPQAWSLAPAQRSFWQQPVQVSGPHLRVVQSVSNSANSTAVRERMGAA